MFNFDGIYRGNITNAAQARIDNSNQELERPLSKEKKKQLIEFIKDELCQKTMKDFAALRAKLCSCLTYHNHQDKKVQSLKKN